MASQNLQFTKISELPPTNTISDTDILVINVSGVTKSITFENLKTFILGNISEQISGLVGNMTTLQSQMNALGVLVGDLNTSVTSLGNRVTVNEGNISTLQGNVTTLSGDIGDLQTRMNTVELAVQTNSDTISNIITAGFNLIGNTNNENSRKE